MTFLTNMSFRKATGSADEVCKRLKELGYTYAPLSDIDGTWAFVKWKEACEKYDLKPVFGVSLHVTEIIAAKKPAIDLWKFYAIDDLKPLNDLVRKAFDQGRSLQRIGFTPLIRYSDLPDIGNLIKVSGYKSKLDFMNPDDENLFVGLSPLCSKGYVKSAIEKGFSFMLTQEARYVNEKDRKFYEISCGFNADLRVTPQHILSEEDLKKEIAKNGIEV